LKQCRTEITKLPLGPIPVIPERLFEVDQAFQGHA
jgi:hypothetical protein